MKLVNGVQHDTFREAAIAHGLIQSEDQWRRCLNEAVTVETNIRRIRILFATICIHCCPSNPNPAELWDEFKSQLIRDFIRNQYTEETAINKALQVNFKINQFKFKNYLQS